MEKIEVKKINNDDVETELVIFLSQEKYFVKDRTEPGIEIPVNKFKYYSLTKQTSDDVSVRDENLADRGADKISYENEQGIFEIFVIQREWIKNKNYKNLLLRKINPTGKYAKLIADYKPVM